MTIDERKIYPGPMEDDKNYYGPLQLPPAVDVHPEGKRHGIASILFGKII